MTSPRFVLRPVVPGSHRHAMAFTLIEMLVVITILAILLALVAPVVSGIGAAGSLNRAAFDIAGCLDRARTYAMANNTYVWVGLAEQDAASSSATAPAGTGAVTLATVASTNGTRAYDPDAPGPLGISLIRPVDRSLRFNNVHLAVAYPPPTAGRPAATPPPVDGSEEVGSAQCLSALSFTAPANGGQQAFSKVIEFNPQGVTRIVASSAGSQAVPDLIEITLQPTRGSILRSSEANVAAIQVTGLTGASHVYRP